MGYAVLHMEKAGGTDSGMSAHIERTIHPKNADESRTHLNRELIEFPSGVENRTQAIQYRLDNAGLKRKIGKNQVRAIRILLTGSPEDMKRIEHENRLDEWCGDNLKWLFATYGKENIVSAVLHMDESTPHIHATLVPIVKGQRKRKKSELEKQVKKRYRSKPSDAPRLCADEIMNRQNLKRYQNTYAEAMNRYGLRRGIEGSKANHISTKQYYRDLLCQTDELQMSIVQLEEKRNEAEKELKQIQKEVQSKEAEGREEVLRLIHLIEKICTWFPLAKEALGMERYCSLLGFSPEQTVRLIAGQEVEHSGTLYCEEYNRKFTARQVMAKVIKNSASNQLILYINGQPITDWFNEQSEKLRQSEQQYPRLHKKGERFKL